MRAQQLNHPGQLTHNDYWTGYFDRHEKFSDFRSGYEKHLGWLVFMVGVALLMGIVARVIQTDMRYNTPMTPSPRQDTATNYVGITHHF